MTGSLDRKGFTLLEVLAAILIFAFGIMALCRVQIGTIGSNTFANDVSQATRIAQDQIDKLMSKSLTDADLADNKGDSTGQDQNNNGIDDDDEGTTRDSIHNFGLDQKTVATADRNQTVGRFNMFWNVAIDRPVAGSRTIRVIVTWTDKRTGAHQVSLDTIKGNHY